MSERVNEDVFVGVLCEYVKKYVESFKIPVPMHIVNRRWGIECQKRLGETVRALIERRSDVFVCGLGISGGTVVSLRPVSDLEMRLLGMFSPSRGTPLSEIEDSLRGSGYQMGELMDALMSLLNADRVRVESGVYYIRER